MLGIQNCQLIIKYVIWCQHIRILDSYTTAAVSAFQLSKLPDRFVHRITIIL